jgi:hypothetical protein
LYEDEVEYLGHIISPAGVATDPKKINTIKKQVKPTTVKETAKIPKSNHSRNSSWNYNSNKQMG